MPDGSTALLLIDLQRDFLSDDGRLPVSRNQVAPMLSAIHRLADDARTADVDVMHIVNAFPRYSIANLFRKFAAIEGSPGAELDAHGPQPLHDEPKIAKTSASAFHRTELDARLHEGNIRRIVLAGVFAGGCVLSTARAGLAHGYEIWVVRDGVADRSDAARTRALRRLEQIGCTLVDTPVSFDHASSHQEAS